jgi:hypothetical protein
VAGFSPPEIEDGIHFVWSEGPFSIFRGQLNQPGQPHRLSFFAKALAESGTSARVSVNGVSLGTVRFEPVWAGSALLVAPEFLKAGTNQIRLDYDATIAPATLHAGSSDQRQLAVRFRGMALEPLPDREAIDLGTSEARPSILDGWSNDEVEGKRTVLWNNGPRSRLQVWLNGQKEARLRIEARAYSPALPLSVEVRLNDNVVGAFQPTADWGVYEVPLDAKFFGNGASVIEFRYDRTAKPSEHEPGSHDERELAVRWDRITIVR